VFWSKRHGATIVDYKFGTTHRRLGAAGVFDDPEFAAILARMFTKRNAR
jgi:hypothetical protein